MLDWIKSAALGIGMAFGGGSSDHQPKHPERPPAAFRYPASEMRRRNKDQIVASMQQHTAEHMISAGEDGIDKTVLQDARKQADQLAE